MPVRTHIAEIPFQKFQKSGTPRKSFPGCPKQIIAPGHEAERTYPENPTSGIIGNVLGGARDVVCLDYSVHSRKNGISGTSRNVFRGAREDVCLDYSIYSRKNGISGTCVCWSRRSFYISEATIDAMPTKFLIAADYKQMA